MTTTNRSEIEHDREPVPDEEAVPTRGTINPGNNQGLQSPDPSRYVFLRIPKKLGEQLVPHDRATPEAWGLYFEEGFLLHHFFLIILSIYILATVAFAAHWCTEYGLVGPNFGAAAFGVSSWMIGLLSLVTTVMFKWAE